MSSTESPLDLKPLRSLRQQMLLVVMTSTCAALLLSACALLTYEILSNRSAWANDIRSQAELIGQSVTPALVFGDRKAAKDALQAFRLRPQIKIASVFDANGTIFASYSREPTLRGEMPTVPMADALVIDFGEVRQTSTIVQDGEKLGTLYLHAHYNLSERIVDYLWILALATASGLAMAALIFRQLHPAITRPIVEMAAVSRRIVEDRDYAVRVQATNGNEVGVLVIAFNNMLEALASEMKERRTAEEALREADRRKDEFLATLAHELRNPLAPLSAGLTLLRRKDDDPMLRAKMHDMMGRQLKQMVRLIDDLLEVSRITRGKLELRRETIDAASVARQAIEATESALKSKAQILTLELPDHPVWINVDGARITQVLVNLLTNAARYTPSGGLISLRLHEAEGKTIVSVTDNGIGIEPLQQQKIFDMFVQVDTSLERGAAGLGIGLTIARELTLMHGGALGVESAGLGRGSTFTVKLPIVPAPEPDPTVDRNVTRITTPLDVLVADDNADFADSFASILRAEGHAVRVVHNGREALDAIEQKRPSVAFLDIGMPTINGLDLAIKLRTNSGNSPMVLIAVTGWGQETDRARVASAGFQHHLVKPIDFDDALQLLAAVTVPGPAVSGTTS